MGNEWKGKQEPRPAKNIRHRKTTIPNTNRIVLNEFQYLAEAIEEKEEARCSRHNTNLP